MLINISKVGYSRANRALLYAIYVSLPNFLRQNVLNFGVSDRTFLMTGDTFRDVVAHEDLLYEIFLVKKYICHESIIPSLKQTDRTCWMIHGGKV